jgi:hypothetical protein
MLLSIPAAAGDVCVPVMTGEVTVNGNLAVGDLGLGSYSLTTSDCDETFARIFVGEPASGNGTLGVSGGAMLTSTTVFGVGGEGQGVANFPGRPYRR